MRRTRWLATWMVLVLSAGCLGVNRVETDPPVEKSGEPKPATTKPVEVVKPASEKASIPTPAEKPAAVSGTKKQPSPTSRPGVRSSGDPKVDALLDRMEKKGTTTKGLSCHLTYRFVTVFPVEDVITKRGELLFRRDAPNAKFLVHFKEYVAGGIVDRKRNEFFLFDGAWLTERNDKARTVIRRQIVREGQSVDPFRLGKGPFPLPFGQRREEMLANFKVKAMPSKAGGPPKTVHLHCDPLPETELAQKYSRVELFIDEQTALPVRIVTERVSDESRIEVDFVGVQTGKVPPTTRFKIETPAGFDVREEPLPPGPKPAPSRTDGE